MTKPQPDPTKHKSRRLLYIAAACAVCAAAVLLAAALLRVRPSAYAPPIIDDPQRISPYLTHRLGPDFYNQVQLDAPFTLEIEQDGLNEIIGYGYWPQQFGAVWVWQPMVVFNKDTLTAFSPVSVQGISSMVTLVARPQQEADGRINLNIQSIRLGRLPVTTLAARIARTAMHDRIAEFSDWPHLEPIIRAIVENAAFEPVYPVYGRSVRLLHFRLESGRLTVLLSPEEDTPVPD